MSFFLVLKSGLLFFIKSKLMIVTLTIIALISSFFFSILILTSTAMSDSFNNLKEIGKVHDFSVDSNFKKARGELALNIKPSAEEPLYAVKFAEVSTKPNHVPVLVSEYNISKSTIYSSSGYNFLRHSQGNLATARPLTTLNGNLVKPIVNFDFVKLMNEYGITSNQPDIRKWPASDWQKLKDLLNPNLTLDLNQIKDRSEKIVRSISGVSLALAKFEPEDYPRSRWSESFAAINLGPINYDDFVNIGSAESGYIKLNLPYSNPAAGPVTSWRDSYGSQIQDGPNSGIYFNLKEFILSHLNEKVNVILSSWISFESQADLLNSTEDYASEQLSDKVVSNFANIINDPGFLSYIKDDFVIDFPVANMIQNSQFHELYENLKNIYFEKVSAYKGWNNQGLITRLTETADSYSTLNRLEQDSLIDLEIDRSFKISGIPMTKNDKQIETLFRFVRSNKKIDKFVPDKGVEVMNDVDFKDILEFNEVSQNWQLKREYRANPKQMVKEIGKQITKGLSQYQFKGYDEQAAVRFYTYHTESSLNSPQYAMFREEIPEISFDIKEHDIKLEELLLSATEVAERNTSASIYFLRLLDLGPYSGRTAPLAFNHPSNYEVAVSYDFAKKNDVEVLPRNILYSYDEKTGENTYFNKFGYLNINKLRNDYPRSVINYLPIADSGTTSNSKESQVMAHVVVGIGAAPNYAYPIIDIQNTAIDVSTQAIVYVSDAGMQRITTDQTSNVNIEETLIGRFSPTLSKKQRKELFSELRIAADSLMRKTSEVEENSYFNGLYEGQATRNIFYLRISTLNSIYSTIYFAALIFGILISLLVVVLFVVIVSQKIRVLRRTLGILEANGMNKFQTSLIFVTIPVLFCFLPILIGFVIAHLLQGLTLSIFDSYWTIQVDTPQFQWAYLVGVMFGSMILFGASIYLATLWIMRNSVMYKINDVDRGSNPLRRLIYFVSAPLGVRAKYAFTMFGANLAKMLLISLSIMATVSATTVYISTLGKFNLVENRLNEINNYSYRINLATPTLQGGQYSAMRLTDNSPIEPNVYKELGYSSMFLNDITLQLPGSPHYTWQKSFYHNYSSASGDFSGQPTNPALNLSYLNHRVIYRPNVDIRRSDSAGSFSIWMMYSSLVESNIVNRLNSNFEEMRNKVTEYDRNAGQLIFQRREFRNKYFMNDTLTAEELSGTTYIEPAMVVFNQAIVNTYDEPYTYLDLTEIGGDTDQDSLNLIGIKENSDYYKLTKSQINSLKDWTTKQSLFVEKDVWQIPILANKFTTDKLHKRVGDTIKVKLNNSIDRYMRSFQFNQGQEINPITIDLKIIGEIDSYKDYEIISLQNYTNQIISNGDNYGQYRWDSLPFSDERKIIDEQSDNLKYNYLISQNGSYVEKADGYSRKYDNSFFADPDVTLARDQNDNPILFNGIMTKSLKPRALNNFAIYSPSGIYPADPRYDPSTGLFLKGTNSAYYLNLLSKSLPNASDLTWNDVFNNKVFAPTYYDVIPNDIYSISNTIRSIQSASVFVGTLIWAILILLLIIAVIFTVVMSSMMLESNRKNSMMLKVLGYSNRDLAIFFSSTYIPSLVLGLLLSIPFTYLMVLATKSILIKLATMTLPISAFGIDYLISVAAGIVFFMLIFGYVLLSMRRSNLRVALNRD